MFILQSFPECLHSLYSLKAKSLIQLKYKFVALKYSYTKLNHNSLDALLYNIDIESNCDFKLTIKKNMLVALFEKHLSYNSDYIILKFHNNARAYSQQLNGIICNMYRYVLLSYI